MRKPTKKITEQPFTRPEVLALIQAAIPKQASVSNPAPVVLKHWDAPLTVHTSDHRPAVPVSELEDRVRTLEALGFRLQLKIFKDESSRYGYSQGTRREDCVSFEAVRP